jgi:hypothetical protein
VRIDPQTGVKSVEYFGKESYIKQMSRAGQRVTAFNDMKTNRTARPETGWRWTIR